MPQNPKWEPTPPVQWPRFGRFNGGPEDGTTFELDSRDAAQSFSIPGAAGTYVLLAVKDAMYDFAWLGA